MAVSQLAVEGVKGCTRCHQERGPEGFARGSLRGKPCVAELARLRRQRDPRSAREAERRYFLRNRDKRVRKNQLYRERHSGPEADFTEEQWGRLLVSHGGLCVYCTLRPADTRDHLVPVSRGGFHTLTNMVPAAVPTVLAVSARS